MSCKSLVIASFAIIVSGCSSWSVYSVQSPVSHACLSRDIKGCSDLTDGVMEYLNDQDELASIKLNNAVNENSDAKSMVAFAHAVDALATEYQLPRLHLAVGIMKSELARKVSLAFQPIKESAPPKLDTPEIVVKIVQPQIILACQDATCSKYSSIQSAIMCVNNECSRWFDPVQANQVMDTRK